MNRGGGPGARRGFTLVEVLMVTAVLGIVVRIALPTLRESLLTARGTEILQQVVAVEQAVAAYAAETGTWPEDAPPGEVPGELVPRYLAAGTAFSREGYTLDFDRWTLVGEIRDALARDRVASVAVRIEDEGVQRGLMRVAAGRLWYRSGDVFSFLLSGP